MISFSRSKFQIPSLSSVSCFFSLFFLSFYLAHAYNQIIKDKVLMMPLMMTNPWTPAKYQKTPDMCVGPVPAAVQAARLREHPLHLGYDGAGADAAGCDVTRPHPLPAGDDRRHPYLRDRVQSAGIYICVLIKHCRTSTQTHARVNRLADPCSSKDTSTKLMLVNTNSWKVCVVVTWWCWCRQGNVDHWLMEIGLAMYRDNFWRNQIRVPKDMEILKALGRKEIESELGIMKEGGIPVASLFSH